jgi:branched-subunit amino acid ABC-type transport system permease component
MRATSENRVIAESLGIRIGRVYVIAFLSARYSPALQACCCPHVPSVPKIGAQFSTIAMSAIVLAVWATSRALWWRLGDRPGGIAQQHLSSA